MLDIRNLNADEKEQLIIEGCQRYFSPFIAKAFEILEPATALLWNWHIDCIAEHLEAVYRNEIQYLVINMPPRSLKTLTTSVAFPAWCFGQNPSLRFILTSFKASLAEKMTRNTRSLLRSPVYQAIFPNTKISGLDRQYNFETTKMGQYFSSSIASVTGEGCDIQICDDPINPYEAASMQARKTANETIRSTLFSRFNNPKTGRFILNMQRLHEDDPTGNMLQDEGWHHLKLPAQALDKTHQIFLGERKWTLEKGDLLFPDRFSADVLKKARDRLGDYNYAGQYLQEPVPIGGAEFQDIWVKYYDPLKMSSKGMNIYIICDPAGGEETNKKKKKTSDWSAFMAIGLHSDRNYYLLDVVRDRLNPTERVEMLFYLHRKWNDLSGKPPIVGYEQYGMMSDIHYIEKKQEDETYHFEVVKLDGAQNKEDRIRRLIPDLQTSRWWFPEFLFYVDCENQRYDLISEIVNSEMPTFPRARYDDMLDALARIYDMSTNFPQPTKTTSNSDTTNDDYSSPYDF